jgi:hypothetical protein
MMMMMIMIYLVVSSRLILTRWGTALESFKGSTGTSGIQIGCAEKRALIRYRVCTSIPKCNSDWSGMRPTQQAKFRRNRVSSRNFPSRHFLHNKCAAQEAAVSSAKPELKEPVPASHILVRFQFGWQGLSADICG